MFQQLFIITENISVFNIKFPLLEIKGKKPLCLIFCNFFKNFPIFLELIYSPLRQKFTIFTPKFWIVEVIKTTHLLSTLSVGGLDEKQWRNNRFSSLIDWFQSLKLPYSIELYMCTLNQLNVLVYYKCRSLKFSLYKVVSGTGAQSFSLVKFWKMYSAVCNTHFMV